MGKEFQIEQVVISAGFDVTAKRPQGIREFYGDDIALLKLAQRVKMSTHARCWQRAALRSPGGGGAPRTARVTPASPQAHLPSLHGGGQPGPAETPGQHLPGPR